MVEIINNVLETNNEPGWQSFAEVTRLPFLLSPQLLILYLQQNEVGSEQLLDNAESYGQYFAQALMNTNINITEDIAQSMAIRRDNIG